MGHKSEKKQLDSLPPNYIYSTDDPFYYGAATCNAMHYRVAVFLSVFFELVIMLAALFAFYKMSYISGTVEKWVVNIQAAFTILSILTSVLLVIGMRLEQPKLLLPKKTFVKVEMVTLLIGAAFSIACMSYGISLTTFIFGFACNVSKIERDFGPIYPFNLSVVFFFAAAMAIWTNIIVQGAIDYILDKHYFQSYQTIELEKSLPVDDQ